MTYAANDGKTYESRECWFWPVDTERNVLINPRTVQFTEDTFRAFAAAVGFGYLQKPERDIDVDDGC